MRIATYEHDGATRARIVEGDAVRPLGDGTDPGSLLTMSPAQRASLPLGAPVAGDDIEVPPRCRLFDDELEEHRDADGRLDLTMTVWRNGEQMGTDSLANTAWSFEQMLVYASRGATLVPGDVIGSGTCGSGCLGELWGRSGSREPRPLEPGDEVTMEVEGIGRISNRIVAGAEPIEYGEPRRRG